MLSTYLKKACILASSKNTHTPSTQLFDYKWETFAAHATANLRLAKKSLWL